MSLQTKQSTTNEQQNEAKDHDPQPIDFHHPYTPYDVQLDFMRAVYGVLEKGDGQVGILESPTGTVRITFTSQFLKWMAD